MAIINEDGSKMIDCREAAQRYGCTMRYIRRLALDGRIEHEIRGGAYLFPAAAVEALKREAAKGEGRHRRRADGFKAG